MENKSIIFITHGLFEEEMLRKITNEVMRVYAYPVTWIENKADISEYFDPTRRQYDANSLLKVVEFFPTPLAIKKIGLFRVDLFIPILTYIFGQATYRGLIGIASLYRLRNEQYGMTSDANLLRERFSKVVLHELGHTFGLLHCHMPDCVMRSSTYVEDIDQKSFHLCGKCREELNKALGELES